MLTCFGHSSSLALLHAPVTPPPRVRSENYNSNCSIFIISRLGHAAVVNIAKRHPRVPDTPTRRSQAPLVASGNPTIVRRPSNQAWTGLHAEYRWAFRRNTQQHCCRWQRNCRTSDRRAVGSRTSKQQKQHQQPSQQRITSNKKYFPTTNQPPKLPKKKQQHQQPQQHCATF
jgi:hypothetical protein